MPILAGTGNGRVMRGCFFRKWTRLASVLPIVGDLTSNDLGAMNALHTTQMIKPFEDRLRLMLWVSPSVNDYEYAVAALKVARSLFACVKVHPQTDAISLTDPRYLPYIELCREFHLPFVSHTEQDSFCSKEMLAELAEKNPDVDFVAVHMGLHSDHSLAMRLISDYSNLYGDTTLVSADIAAETVEICRAEKILFGTDAPVM